MNVYVLRNRLISAYNPPVFAVEDKESFKTNLSRFCVLEKDTAKKNHYDESELYFLGTYNDTEGSFELLDKPEFIIDLGQFFK